MSFKTRNPYYLRVSQDAVLPLYLYLDDRHLDWMSDRILQHVLEDVRPNILTKLKTEIVEQGSSKEDKRSLETHRGETYQFCYFLRKDQPHAVLMKTRTFSAAVPMGPPPVSSNPQKRRKPQAPTRPRKKAKNKGKGKATEIIDDSSSSEDEPRRPSRKGSTRRTALDEESYSPGPDTDMEVDSHPLDLDEEEEEKPKPILHLKYRGFDILGHCLCIVVEPWPPIRSTTVIPSALRGRSKTPALNLNSMLPPPVPEVNTLRREATPLFLPDRDRSMTPFPFDPDRFTPLPQTPQAEFDLEVEEDDGWGMMELSQVLHTIGDVRAAPMNDDDDMEGAVFFGDADEVKEL